VEGEKKKLERKKRKKREGGCGVSRNLGAFRAFGGVFRCTKRRKKSAGKARRSESRGGEKATEGVPHKSRREWGKKRGS